MVDEEQTWTVLRVLRWTAGYFRERGLDSPRLDAELLLADTLGVDRVGLYLRYDQPLTDEELAAYRRRVARRAKHEPVAYILGKVEFWSLSLKVSSAVLIPRPDTEVLVEEALARGCEQARVLDVGTGSGAIVVALAGERPDWTFTALDLSQEALQIARENARRHDMGERISFVHGDLAHLPDGPFDLIVANPPYIPRGELAGLMADVRDYEPMQALDGGEDGLEAYRALAAQAISRLAPGGCLLVEIGAGQQDDVRRLFETAGLLDIATRTDYAGIERIVGGCAPL
ncbi:MAG TPA: peptide chain release factor N(5)-glutamine methyltransferase [Geoalkalibacter subterraneus]|uniref:Release factor glutamine methyltransferase n=1 Tax=Geoalkalibacter subterraneus TaxID=483547 RepID=A0A831LDM3_9BACT|nr:peptide chain release factor N(5)-glutamine methyltransferase [Geoalkalibacter subterraneus]